MTPTFTKSKGIDFIICDHHVPDDVLPDAAAILNPKLVDDKYPYKDLSGCGVGYKFMQGFAQSNGIDNMYDLENSLDLLAVSIAADLVPLTGENRILTHYGIKRLNNNPCTGLRSILRLCRLTKKEITISDIIFKIGPLINASGRMQSGQESVELLITRSSASAYEITKKIDKYNQSRKELDRIAGLVQLKGHTLLPIKLYLARGRIKLELGLGKGKQLYDKRETLKRKTAAREAARGDA